MYAEICTSEESGLVMATWRHCGGFMTTWRRMAVVVESRWQMLLWLLLRSQRIVRTTRQTLTQAKTGRAHRRGRCLFEHRTAMNAGARRKEHEKRPVNDDDNRCQNHTVTTKKPKAVQVDLIPTFVTTAMKTTEREWRPCRDLRRWKSHREYHPPFYQSTT